MISELMFKLFVNRTDAYSEQYLDKETNKKGFKCIKKKLTLELIKKHINDQEHLGVYNVLPLENSVKWGCLDFDLNTEEDFDTSQKLFLKLKGEGLHPLMEKSGGGDYKIHIWVFTKGCSATDMQNYLKHISEKIKVKPNEIFPKQTEVKEGVFGNLVKLPLGEHLVTKRKSIFLDDDFNLMTIEDIEKRLQYQLDNLDVIPKMIMGETPVIKTEPSKTPKDNCAFLDYCLTHELPVGKRHEVISRNMSLYIYNHPSRSLLKKQYTSIQKGSLKELNNWLKNITENGIDKYPFSCGQLINYQKEYKITSKCRGCPKFREYKREKKEEEKLKEEKDKQESAEKLGKAITYFTDKKHLAKQFLKIQPLSYDRNKMWWVWNFEEFKWVELDETDILNSISKNSPADTITSTQKNEIIEALKQTSRLNVLKEGKESWIQFKDKIYDIETDETFTASPDYFMTNSIPYEVGETEDTPELDKLFVSWVGEKHKEELYEIITFCLIPVYFIHRIICLIGSGANGKGTFLKVLKKFVGIDNITSTSLEMLMKTRFEGAKLYKKLICLMGETNFNTLSRTEFIKGATGEDTLRGENKGKKPFDFVNYAKFIMATNCLPMTQDKTDGFYRRWKIIDFPNKFKKEQEVLDNIPKEEYNNLCLKCLNIIKRLWKNRIFTNDGNFEDRKKRYEAKSNPLMLFINRHYEREVNGSVLFADFSELFKAFLENGGYRELSGRIISIQLKEEGFDIRKTTINKINASWILGLKKNLQGRITQVNEVNDSSLNSLHGKTSEGIENLGNLGNFTQGNEK